MRKIAAFDFHRSLIPAHTIRGVGAVMEQQRIERPIGIGDHVNSVRAQQDRDVAGGSGRLGRVQDLVRVIYEPAHECLIEKPDVDSSGYQR